MAALKLIFILIFGDFIKYVVLYNPMLTYTVRFKKVSLHPSNLGNFTIHQYRESQFVNGNLTVPLNSLPDKTLFWKAVITFYRCDAEGINCEYFQTWTFSDICLKLKEKNQIWSRWYGSFDPPMVCPLDKVHYHITNGTFDIGSAILLYPQATDYQWRVIQKYYADDNLISTMIMEFSFFGYRRKNKFILKP
ncbi:unnamed protein product [Macrosiphum euphorbiae]|uniref:Uncharacterized protein n=1 Tax=Macrosiphum euphorbiae TaxID=13131 RepID=A0AAV0XAB8_9HEMI|nr:unnamed protein product [Macrosiphum euphorbiae]